LSYDGITVEDVYRPRRHFKSDVLIYCRLEDVYVDTTGDLVLVISKESRAFLSFLIRYLKSLRGRECSISIRFKD